MSCSRSGRFVLLSVSEVPLLQTSLWQSTSLLFSHLAQLQQLPTVFLLKSRRRVQGVSCSSCLAHKCRQHFFAALAMKGKQSNIERRRRKTAPANKMYTTVIIHYPCQMLWPGLPVRPGAWHANCTGLGYSLGIAFASVACSARCVY